ncbi:MAG: OmpH family outer membrane protein [Chitinophagaceae bacterium]|nr:OmpH family outer membrane protein [Chitinophagaceae bacterium]
MKNISTYLSLLALVLIGVLFYLHFSPPKNDHEHIAKPAGNESAHFRIAYFDIDSLQNNYQYFKDVSGQIKKKEGDITAQLSSLQDSYQKRIKELQAKSSTMTQTEGEAAQREYTQMQQKYQQRQMAMEQDLKKIQIDMMTDVRNKIENYLKEYNKQHGYAFILSYEPGFMLYYKDSTYDITNDVIAGLNEEYKNGKK